ncbi:MAG: tetratricopeptide repeat protein [Bacillota bacterium]
MKAAYGNQVLSTLLMVVLCSCQSPQNRAKETLAQELTARQANRVKSMQLYASGVQAQKQSRPAEARNCFSAAIEADGDNVYAWMSLGAMAFDEANYYRAAEAFHRASKLAPTRYEPLLNAGTVYETVGRFADAIKSYEAALRLDPDQLETLENLARTYIRASRNPQRARELIDQALLRERRPEWRQWLLAQSIHLSCVKATPMTDGRMQQSMPATQASACDCVAVPNPSPRPSSDARDCGGVPADEKEELP